MSVHLRWRGGGLAAPIRSRAAALAAPVAIALLLAGCGGYALEVVEGEEHRLAPVSVGLFDDAEGLVAVSGPGISAGQRIVVPAE